MTDLSGADRGYGLRVERSREVRLSEGDAGDPRGVACTAFEVEVSWVEARPATQPRFISEREGRGPRGRGVREVVDLFTFKEMFREAGRRGLPVALAPGYAHRKEDSDPALKEGAETGAPPEETGERFDLLALVRSLLRREQESLGPAYG